MSQKKSDFNTLKYLPMISHYITTFAANILIGGIIGFYLDRWTNLTPLFLTIFCFLGFLSGIKSVYHLIVKTDRRNKR